jgi:hypothetical protein
MMIEQGGVYSLGPLKKRIWVTRRNQVLHLQHFTILIGAKGFRSDAPDPDDPG